MPRQRKEPRSSLAVLRLGRRRLAVLPRRSLRQGLLSLGLVLIGLVAIDSFVIPRLEAYLPDPAWHHEDDVLVANMMQRNDARRSGDWVWRSRGHPVTPERPKLRRILVMGDSFVWGDGYANMNDLWWMQLQRELRGRGYAQVEVIAAGLMGAATHDELKQARSLVPRYRPDLVIWGHVTNDPDEGLVPRFREDMDAAAAKDALGRTLQRLVELGWLPRLADHLLERRKRVLARELVGAKRGYEQDEWRRRLLRGPNLAEYRRTLAELARFQEESGIPGLGIELPVVPDREKLRELFGPVPGLYEEAGLPMVELTADFLAEHPSGRAPGGSPLGWGVNPVNGHPGAIVTSFLASETADYLEEHELRILGPRTEPVTTLPLRVNDWLPYFLEPESLAPGSVSFTQPRFHPLMRYMPVKWPHVQLNLELPTPVEELVAEGPELTVARVHVTVIDPELGYDDGTVHDLGEARGTRAVFSLAGRPLPGPVNTIGFAAGFSGDDRRVTLTARPPAAGP